MKEIGDANLKLTHPIMHNSFHPTIRDGSTWSKFGARGEHGDIFLFSTVFFPSDTLMYGISRDGYRILTYALVSTWSLVSSRWEHIKRKVHPCIEFMFILLIHSLIWHKCDKYNSVSDFCFDLLKTCWWNVRGYQEYQFDLNSQSGHSCIWGVKYFKRYCM